MVVKVTRVVTRVVLVVFEEATNHNHCEQSCSRNQRDIGLEHLQDPGVVPHKRNLTGGHKETLVTKEFRHLQFSFVGYQNEHEMLIMKTYGEVQPSTATASLVAKAGSVHVATTVLSSVAIEVIVVVAVTRVLTKVVLVICEDATNHNHCEQICSSNQRDMRLSICMHIHIFNEAMPQPPGL